MGSTQLPLVLFDDGSGRFGPLTDLRACFELRTGALTTAERAASGTILWAPAQIAPLVRARHAAPVNALPASAQELMLLNGRIVDIALPVIGELTEASSAVIESRSGHIIAARLRTQDARAFLEHGTLPASMRRTPMAGVQLLARPWEILDPEILATRLRHDLMMHCASWPAPAAMTGVVCFGKERLMVHPEARVLPGVIIDTDGGPVAIDAGATIRPGAVIVGPAFIGVHSIVAERSLIKARTVIGPHCRVAGEIGSTIFQGYANKAHDGHLGDSFIGEWVNLGAGTTNSNLLNTYGEIALRLEPDAPLERTGRQFVGAIVGDHVKTAILTRLPTGCVLGTGSMIATSAFAPSLLPRFSWLTDEGRRLYRFDKFIEVARAVWKRRGIEPSAAMLDGLRELHERAARMDGTAPEATRGRLHGEAR